MTLIPTPPEQPVEGEVLDVRSEPLAPIVCACGSFLADCDHPVPPDQHAITRTPYRWGVAWVCACGRWEGVATGPSSAAWCERSYTQHRAEEEAVTRGQ